jgi:hypothetical protein
MRVSPGQTFAIPPLTVIDAGVAGLLLTETASDWEVLLPQLLFAVTVILPLVVPAVTEMEFEEDEPTHPEGSVQL